MNQDNFWNDKKKSENVISELNYLKKQLDITEKINKKINDDIDTLNLLKDDPDDEMLELLLNGSKELNKELSSLELELLLSGKYDSYNVIMDIHSGAGGTEACDWANMIYRMYTRYCELKNYKIEIIDEQPGDEVGIKSVSLIIRGVNAYGYLKNEMGIHRLVRISPFDSNSRRHTSFASVSITPLFENNDIKLDIKDSDLKIDVYRSSGCGGQGVNTTDSAVRITHLPTKTVVTCQNERSQIQNKEKAMEVLMNKLYKIELEKREAKINNIKGEQKDINFGSQIRSYVMHPYSMVKDHRTNVETSNVEKVLDGDIDLFIDASLRSDNSVL